MSDAYTPKPEHKFTFGLWTVGNSGRDPFGDVTRKGYATLAQRNKIVKEFKKALNDYGMCVPMATTNLFYDPVFKDGAFTSNDARVRAYAIQKTMNAIDLGIELGATVYVFWGGREGAEVDFGKNPQEAIKRFREAMNFLCAYVRDQKYDLKFALEAKPNEPRGDLYFPTTGAYLGFITTLDYPDMVGVNPEVAHEQMAALNFPHAVAQALEAGKLFHIDLNDQKYSRFDQDLRFGSEMIKAAFFLVKLLEDSGYAGSRHFDAHAYRTEDRTGVKDFAAGCMRTYLILKEKVEKWNGDAEIQGLVKEIIVEDPKLQALSRKYSRANAQALKKAKLDRKQLVKHPLRYEKLDQLTMEVLLGVR
jgi:xylose isomerase